MKKRELESRLEDYDEILMNHEKRLQVIEKVLLKKIKKVERLKIGDTIRLRSDVSHRCPKGREDNDTAMIRSLAGAEMDQIMTDRDLRGCRFWNIEDVEKC